MFAEEDEDRTGLLVARTVQILNGIKGSMYGKKYDAKSGRTAKFTTENLTTRNLDEDDLSAVMKPFLGPQLQNHFRLEPVGKGIPLHYLTFNSAARPEGATDAVIGAKFTAAMDEMQALLSSPDNAGGSWLSQFNIWQAHIEETTEATDKVKENRDLLVAMNNAVIGFIAANASIFVSKANVLSLRALQLKLADVAPVHPDRMSEKVQLLLLIEKRIEYVSKMSLSNNCAERIQAIQAAMPALPAAGLPGNIGALGFSGQIFDLPFVGSMIQHIAGKGEERTFGTVLRDLAAIVLSIPMLIFAVPYLAYLAIASAVSAYRAGPVVAADVGPVVAAADVGPVVAADVGPVVAAEPAAGAPAAVDTLANCLRRIEILANDMQTFAQEASRAKLDGNAIEAQLVGRPVASHVIRAQPPV